MAGKIAHSRLQFARAIVGLMAVFVLGGILWYGLAPEQFARLWRNLLECPDGPMLFRFFLQPTIATMAAVMSGIADARLGRTPFWQSVLSNPAERGDRFNEAIVDTSRIMLLGLVMDSIYQYIAFDSFHPAEAVIIALLLTLLPYLLLRGLVARVARRRIAPTSPRAPVDRARAPRA